MQAIARPADLNLDRRRLALLLGGAALGLVAPPLQAAPARKLAAVLAKARQLEQIRSMLVAHHGKIVAAERFRGPDLDTPVNVKSASKSVMATLIGIAIDKGVLAGPEQPILPLLGDLAPEAPDRRLATITIDHLLSMRAGLERTSGRNYGAWVTSVNWVRHALSRPFVDRPGGRMLYSTGSTHLLSAALTRTTGRSTLAVAREWLGAPLDIAIPPWERDPQGFYMGGNNMLLSPTALLRLGETYRSGGVHAGRQVVSRRWIEASWTPRTRSPFTGHQYGYGWFIAQARGHAVYYGWGYGGQMIYVVPSLALTTVITSNPDGPSGHNGYIRGLHRLLADGVIPALGSLEHS